MLVWTEEEYGTGVEEVDEQHKEWFTRINALQAAAEAGKRKSEIWNMLEFVESYTCKHFGFEEGVMKERKCSACKANRAAHAAFSKEFQLLKHQFDREGASEAFQQRFEEKVVGWIRAHIGNIDTQLRETVKT